MFAISNQNDDDEREDVPEDTVPTSKARKQPNIYVHKNQGLRLATWNAAILGYHTCPEVNDFCLRNKIDIMCIQESGASEYVKPKFDNYVWFDKWSTPRNHNLGIMIRKTLIGAINDISGDINNESKVISSKWIKFQTHESDNNCIIIGNYYVPGLTTTRGNKTKRKATLQGIRGKIKYTR